MTSWKKPTAEMVEKALGSVKRETDRRYFFSRLKNPLWLQPLVERGYFASPPQALDLGNGHIQFPYWPELQYLKNVSRLVPEQVVSILADLPSVDNPHVYLETLEIALVLPVSQSVKLKDKILESTSLGDETWPHSFVDLLAHWNLEDEVAAALELAAVLIKFHPDPKAREKRQRYKKDSGDWNTYLDPKPQFEGWCYGEILNKGVRPLAKRAPYETARMLIDAVAAMISLSNHPSAHDGNRDSDTSEVWCRLLGKRDRDSGEDEREALAHTLTFACEQVYKIDKNKVVALDGYLRKQRRLIFKRLRMHLYAQFPTEQTKPWIQDIILGHEHYGRSEYGYEFQLMVRRACQRFGANLLTEERLSGILDTVLAGPPKDAFSKWLGDEFTEEKFSNRQRHFHRMQFRMFEPVLFGDYLAYFQKLEAAADEQISDDDYSRVRGSQGGFISPRSPMSTAELASMQDETVLNYINEWDAEHRDKDDWLVEISIEALADAFQGFFTDTVLPNTVRLHFWSENRREIARPIYVKAIVDGMKVTIEGKNLERLEESLEFCEWVLSHPDQERETDFGYGDQSRDNPLWASSRRAVGDLIDTCIEKEVNVPYSYREQLTKLLDALCTQFDWRLDQNKPVMVNRKDQLTEALNNTRSRALESLFKFGSWIRDNDPNADLGAVTNILERRFNPETEHPLTLPERAMLGTCYPRLLYLESAWATAHRTDVFPQTSLPAWREAFGSFLRYTRPSKPSFEVLRDDYDYAIQHLAELGGQDDSNTLSSDKLGQHLFFYFVWGLYPLKGEDSYLERFYESTKEDRERWSNLLSHIGLLLRNTKGPLDERLTRAFVDFFEWRLEAGETSELGKFYRWLDAECLEADWRLDAFSRVLDATKGSTSRAVSIAAKTLEGMLPEHTNEVVECFVKLTDAPQDSTFYVNEETAKHIIQAGLQSHSEDARENAKRARDNLLRRGFFDLLSLED